MQFTLVECGYHSYWESFPWLLLTLALPVGLPLLIWLRRSSRNVRDVLRPVPAVAVGMFQRSLDVAVWVLLAAALLVSHGVERPC